MGLAPPESTTVAEAWPGCNEIVRVFTESRMGALPCSWFCKLIVNWPRGAPQLLLVVVAGRTKVGEGGDLVVWRGTPRND